ncbi:hypothetical protein [Hansschlegelia sp. KR7-227]|uniref:hypothetical protein n=1 Tax=Hansschlegelia sp. KR7-227 TaxID=3400914 RepID=UPI003C08ED85
MTIILVTYDLKKPGRNYADVHTYLRQYTHCKHLESVYLLDTSASTGKIRDDLTKLIDNDDITFVVKLARDWSSWDYLCSDWLNRPERNW